MSDAPLTSNQEVLACEVPLTELLRKVPIDARHAEEYYAPLHGTQWHPVGCYCHRAADEIERLSLALGDLGREAKANLDAKDAEIERLRAALIEIATDEPGAVCAVGCNEIARQALNEKLPAAETTAEQR